MSGIINGAINTVANVLRTPEEQAHRDRQIRYWTMIQTAGVATLIATGILVLLIPKIITLVLAGLYALLVADVISMSSNMLEMTRDVTVSATARLSKENLIDQTCKNTLFGRTAINLINPSFEEMIRDIDRIGT